MLPALHAGDDVIALRPWRRVRVGDVVVFRDPRRSERWLIKRCHARHGHELDLRGDNEAASTDSREFGLVAQRDIVYLVISPRLSGK